MVAFRKMHGLGNDFVVVDCRRENRVLAHAAIRDLADRRTGIGFDQLILIEPSTRDGDIFMRIYNADGGEVETCGNATRCVARLLFDERDGAGARIETKGGVLFAQSAGALIAVDMGVPRLGWAEIPLARACDTLHVPFVHGALADPVATNIGNPHVTFFVADADAVDLAGLGPAIETDAMFPERVNVGVASPIDGTRLRLRVFERGVGITSACGSGACAALVAAARRGLVERRARLVLDGGELDIDWRADGHVWMTGPATEVFQGSLPESAFA